MSLISVDHEGYAAVPLHNYQGNCVTLMKGSPLGSIRQCKAPNLSPSQVQGSQGSEFCNRALVGAILEDASRFEELVHLLGISANKPSPDQMSKLRGLLHEFAAVFALNDQELGCTGIVHHSIDTGEHRPIKQQPYRTAITRRDTIN